MTQARICNPIGVLLLTAALAFGQGNGQGGPANPPPGQGSGQPAAPGTPPATATPNPTRVVATYNGGTITDVLASSGAKYPAIEFKLSPSAEPFEVLLAPLWYLEEEFNLGVQELADWSGLTADLVVLIRTTDEVEYHAIQIRVPAASGTLYVFRTEDGKPLWNGSGKKPKDRAAKPIELRPGSVREVSGEVERVAESQVTEEPKLLMLGDDGYRYRIRLGSGENLLAAGVRLRERSRVRVRYALDVETGGAVGLELTTEAQISVRLREGDGSPAAPEWK